MCVCVYCSDDEDEEEEEDDAVDCVELEGLKASD